MPHITDFYAEFSIAQSASLEDIKKKLLEERRIWISRQVSRPELATKKLAFLNDADVAFKNEASRADYDRKLAESRRKPETADPNAERHAKFQWYLKQARNFYNVTKYDLAKTAIEDAAQYASRANDDPEYCHLASKIYRFNNDIDSSLRYINRAIIADPTDARHDMEKGLTYGYQRNYVKMQETLKEAFEKAENNRNDSLIANIAGLLAFSMYYDGPQDVQKARTYAALGVRLGDSYGNAQRVLEAIEKTEQDAKAARERAEQDAIAARETAERNARIAREKAEQAERMRLESEKAAMKRYRIAKSIERRDLIMFVLGWIVLVLSVPTLYFAYYGYYVSLRNVDLTLNLVPIIMVAFFCYTAFKKSCDSLALTVAVLFTFVYSAMEGERMWSVERASIDDTWAAVGRYAASAAIFIFIAWMLSKIIGKWDDSRI